MSKINKVTVNLAEHDLELFQERIIENDGKTTWLLRTESGESIHVVFVRNNDSWRVQNAK